LIQREIPNFELERYLRYGGLPAVYLSKYPHEELDAYVNTRDGNFEALYWEKFLDDLWSDKFVR